MADITIAKGELHKLYEDALLGFIIADPEKLLEVSEKKTGSLALLHF